MRCALAALPDDESAFGQRAAVGLQGIGFCH